MTTVHKAQIYPGTGPQIVPGKPIAFQMQDGIPSCWYEVGDWYEVRVVATGEPVDDEFQYVATLQFDWLVFHLYVRKK